MKRLVFPLWVILICITTAPSIWGQPRTTRDSVNKDYSAELPRIPPKTPDQALASFRVSDGFGLELVAAEPLVTDPVAFAFDARDRLFVVEMRGYSEQPTERLGRIALLVDANRDGQMDHRSTFVDGLSWPTAIWPWKDGVLVAEAPKITWYRDTDDDGVSDTQEDWFVGFGRSNVQGLVNSLRWGCDGWIHGATSSSGANIRQLAHGEDAQELLGRRDFAIDPLSKTLRAESGGGQHGLSFNRWGDKFVTSNSDHLQQVIDIDSWLSGHSSGVALPSTRRSIAEDGPQAEVFRISPVEPWRIVRTRLRVSGIVAGVVEGGGRAAGYFTGATGTWIMDREAGFGDGEHDTALICDVGSNLVHRKRLVDQGLFWTGQRMDETTELLASSDTWFRPVQLGDGPDGALYIADMYREVIEHPKSLPPMIKKHLDLTSGRDRGRIWRLVPKGAHTEIPASPSRLTSKELVQRLSHPVAWQRRMASQLLIERGTEDVRSELREAMLSGSPEGRILAMGIASRQGFCTKDLIRKLLSAEHARVVQHAIRLVGQEGLAAELADDLQPWVSTEDPRIQLEMALVASELPSAERSQLLGGLLIHAQDSLVRAVIANAAGNESWALLHGASAARLPRGAFASWLRLLLPVWAKQLDRDQSLAGEIAKQLSSHDAQKQALWLDAISELPSATDAQRLLGTLDVQQRERITALIEHEVTNAGGDSSRYTWLRLLPPEAQLRWAERLLEPAMTETAQRAAIGNLAWANHESLADLLLDRFQSMTPALQLASLRALTERQSSTIRLADALDARDVLPSQIPPDLRQRLVGDRNRQLAKRFETLLAGVAADRAAVIENYTRQLESISVPGREQLGRDVFQKACAQCHRLGGVGSDVGPPLNQLRDKTPQQLMEAILDPNREVDPKYVSYSVLLTDGRTFAGIIQDESATQIVLAEAGGKMHVIRRQEIELLRNSGTSLMPVGLEQQVSAEQMAPLLNYLRSVN